MSKIDKDDVEHFKTVATLNKYQHIAVKSAVYPGKGTPFGLMYCALGLGEAGEVQNKVKKAFRDDGIVQFERDAMPRYFHVTVDTLTPERKTQIIKEMGGTLWYLAALATELNVSLSDVATMNLEELAGRTERGTLQGDGMTITRQSSRRSKRLKPRNRTCC